MGSLPEGPGAGEWKGGHLRIASEDHTGSLGEDDSPIGKGDGDLELHEVHNGGEDSSLGDQQQQQASGRAKRGFQFPRFGLGGRGRDGPVVDGSGGDVDYKVYKRRWFGLIELTLLSLLVSWEVSAAFFSPYHLQHRFHIKSAQPGGCRRELMLYWCLTYVVNVCGANNMLLWSAPCSGGGGGQPSFPSTNVGGREMKGCIATSHQQQISLVLT